MQHKANKLLLDRRDYPRVKRHLEIEFRPLDTPGKFRPSEGQNISLGGLRVEIPPTDPVTLGQVVELLLTDPKGRLTKLQAVGRIAWIQKSDHGHGLEAGIRLTFIDENVKSAFSKYLQRITE